MDICFAIIFSICPLNAQDPCDPCEVVRNCSTPSKFMCLRQRWSDLSREKMALRCRLQNCQRICPPSDFGCCQVVCKRPPQKMCITCQPQACCNDTCEKTYCLHFHIKRATARCQPRLCC